MERKHTWEFICFAMQLTGLYINRVEANNRSINKLTNFIINSTLRGRIHLEKGFWGREQKKRELVFFSWEGGGGGGT